MDYSQLKEEVFSDFIQNLIPQSQQKLFGQVYTPHKIAKLMVDLVITRPNINVLDPACGCGVLLTETYQKLQNLCLESDNTEYRDNLHKKLLKQIWGVELYPYPAHLTMLRLAMMDLSTVTDEIGVIIHDFLNLGPLEKYFVNSSDPLTGKTIQKAMPQKYDLIIANPPYIKQEKIPNKKAMMKQLPIYASYRKKNIFSGNYHDLPQTIPLDITGKSDYYGFFLWYSTFFLKSNGILCFLIPDKWMDVKYGEKIKRFLKDHYAIKQIIGFQQNIFENAQVSSIILIAKRVVEKEVRDSNITKFILLEHADFTSETITKIRYPISQTYKKFLKKQSYYFDSSQKDMKCTYILQNHLSAQEKWTYKYLFQSKFSHLLNQSPYIKLHNKKVSKVIGGLKTGANAFFFPSKADRQKFNIEQQFLRPGIKSGRDIPNGYIVNRSSNPFLSIPANCNLSRFPGLSDFIKYCEETKGYHLRPSVKWDPWYAIPPSKQIIPNILFLRHINQDFQAKLNIKHCITADGIRGIQILNPNDLFFYLGVCNSKFFYWQAHVEGRWEGQGDLQLLVYELKNFKIPDITRVSISAKKKVISCIHRLLEHEEKHGTNVNAISLQKNLDLAVLATFGLEDAYDLLLSELNWLEQKRLNKKFS